MKLLFMVLAISVLLVGCTQPPAPTPTPLATATPTATPLPTTLASPTPTPEASATPTCTDSDNGMDYLKTGTASDADGAKVDACDGSDVVEHYCEGNSVKKQFFTCEYGCENGACKRPPEVANFTFGASPRNAFVTPCKEPEVIFNVRNAPKEADVSFFANWGGLLAGALNPEKTKANRDGFAESKALAGAGCVTKGSVLSNFTAQVCFAGDCFNKTIAVNYSAGRCVDTDGCDQNKSIEG